MGPDKSIAQPPYITLLLEELCIEIFNKLNYLDQHTLGLSCKKIYFISKNTGMWVNLYERMNSFILLHSSVCPIVSFLNIDNKEPIFGIKDIVCVALKESRPEALLAKCMFFFDNNRNYTKRYYLRAYDQILLINGNELNVSINSALRIKIDLLHAELLMIINAECGGEGGGDEDLITIRNLLEGVLANEATSNEDINWTMCLLVQLYYYTHCGLVYGSMVEKSIFMETFERPLIYLQEIIGDPSASISCKAIANLNKALIGYCGLELGVFRESEVYELFKECMDKPNKSSPLPMTYQAKCILHMAIMDYQKDLPNGNKEENEKLFADFKKVIQNKFAFQQDKTIAMLYLAIMRYRDLIDSITYLEAEHLLDKIIKNNLSSSIDISTAKMYKASMNYAKQSTSMTNNEIYEVFEKFIVNDERHIRREDKSLAMINMGLMLVQKNVQRINPIRVAHELFTQVSQISISNEFYAQVELQYIAMAKQELAHIELSNGKIRRRAIL